MPSPLDALGNLGGPAPEHIELSETETPAEGVQRIAEWVLGRHGRLRGWRGSLLAGKI